MSEGLSRRRFRCRPIVSRACWVVAQPSRWYCYHVTLKARVKAGRLVDADASFADELEQPLKIVATLQASLEERGVTSQARQLCSMSM